MDLLKIAEIGNAIYMATQCLSLESHADIDRLKALAIALFAELDHNE